MSSALTENRLLLAKMARGLILDCGCGQGLYRDVLGARGETIGADVKKEYLVKSSYPIKIVCSVTHLPFKDEVFDFVWACAVIEHVKQDCIGEIIRVAKHTVIVTPNKHSLVDFFKRLLGRETWWSPGHVRLYGVEELNKYGRVYGDGPGVPKRSFWVKFLPSRFWLLFPRLSHVLILDARC